MQTCSVQRASNVRRRRCYASRSRQREQSFDSRSTFIYLCVMCLVQFINPVSSVIFVIFDVQVAASFDRSGFKYKMMYSLQGSRKEMIENLHEIMIEQLKHFKNVNKLLPRRILYYRDGVSEGQFRQVSLISPLLSILYFRSAFYEYRTCF